MITFDEKRFSIYKDNGNQKIIKLKMNNDFDLAINYIKGQENFVSMKIKLKFQNLKEYYYLTEETRKLKKVEYIFTESDAVFIQMRNLPKCEEILFEINFECDENIIDDNLGNIDLNITTFKYN